VSLARLTASGCTVRYTLHGGGILDFVVEFAVNCGRDVVGDERVEGPTAPAHMGGKGRIPPTHHLGSDVGAATARHCRQRGMHMMAAMAGIIDTSTRHEALELWLAT